MWNQILAGFGLLCVLASLAYLLYRMLIESSNTAGDKTTPAKSEDDDPEQHF